MPCADNGQSEGIKREAERKKAQEKERNMCTYGNFSSVDITVSNSAPLDLSSKQKRITHLEAIICALTNECSDEIICRAERNGKVDIFDFIQKHKKDDRQRLKSVLYSTFAWHEIKMIADILKGENK